MNVKTYVLHCKKLTDRFQFMNQQMSDHGFTNVTWYTDDDASDLEGKDLTGLYGFVREEILLEKCKVGGWSVPSNIFRQMSLPEISLTTKWGKVLEFIGKGDDPYVCVFEDDVILCDNFSEKFNLYLSETPDDWDVIYMGNGANLHAPNVREGKLAYKVNHPASRCLDSIIMKKDAAAKLAEEYFPFDLCSDWEIGYQQARHNLNVYWWEPTICTQGSETGKFKTTLR